MQRSESFESPSHESRELLSLKTLPSPVESLFNPGEHSPWPEYIKNNEEIRDEVALRQSLISKLDIFDLENSDASEAKEIYEQLVAFLKNDEAYDRLILYMPFELLPSKEFAEVYLQKWHALLKKHDIRADFVDGDVPELEIRTESLPLVVKAAHLIPVLVQKNLLSVEEVFELMKRSDDVVLKNSIADTLPVLSDMNLLTEEHIASMLDSDDDLIQSLGVIIKNDLEHPQESFKHESRPLSEEELENLPPARAKWLREREQEKALNVRSVGKEVDAEEFLETAKAIESNPELSKLLMPVSIVYGSKIKGYAADNADTDVAVFVKPDVPLEEKDHIQQLLNPSLQFWLQSDGENVRIKDFPEPQKNIGDNTSVSVLLGGAWSGDEATIKELHEKVLTQFLYSKDKTIMGQDARALWLREMERDALQYRLMHKGYERLHSRQSGLDTKHSHEIDSESVFWDPGYRKLATKLFLERVFLPQLDK